MAATTISIELDGYWLDEKKSGLPAVSAVYCVYECTKNVDAKKETTVTLHKLIYIGESENVKGRVADHEKYEVWLKHVRQGNELCFSCGPVEGQDRERAEAATIFRHKPPENTEYVDSFPFDRTTMALSGKTRLLTTDFTVDRTV